MNFGKALEALKAGYKVKLSSWAGYWQKEGDTVKMHCKDGRVLDIRETEDVFYTLAFIASDEWEVVGDCDMDLNIRTVRFGEALRLMKQGKNVARKGWNGKDQFVCLIPATNNMWRGFPMQDCFGIKTVNNEMQPGWIPSIRDLLAEDWYEVE